MSEQPSALRLLGESSDSERPRCCDLCGAQKFEVIGRRDRHGRPLETGICVRCGLVAHVEIPSREELHQFYASDYRQQYHGETTPSARRVMRAWRNAERIHAQLQGYLHPGEAVFEVGAGIGCTVKLFELRGFRASGIDPGEGFQRFSREQIRADVADRNLFDLEPRPTFDVVLLVHVIEHVDSPTLALEWIHGLLKPGGRLYVECPNLSAPFARRSRLFHFAHIHNFTPSSISMLAEKCGFRVAARLSSGEDANLQVLLERTEHRRLQIDPENYRRTLRDLERYNGLSYHLRWNYLAPRCRKLLAYAREHLWAARELRQVLAACAAHEGDSLNRIPLPQTSPARPRRKAA